MRFRVGLVLCLFVAYIAAGCRTALAPNIDRNLAPETWITAAPFDTITIKDGGGRPIEDPRPTTIPVRFHVYWAGSDQDGAVAGYYWAVTETLPTPEPGFIRPPNLPGPKPNDYHYTTRSDSTFIFNVAAGLPDRQHAFFVYAVDNQGKADATPARFIFNSIDNFPPRPIFLVSKGVGTIYAFNANGDLIAIEKEFPITDQDKIGTVPRDTVSANSTLIFKWTAEPRIAGSVVTGYRYKLDEPDYLEVDTSVTQAIYHSGVGADTVPVAPGRKSFRLFAVDQAGGMEDSTRRFIVNFSPDTWWSGPDPLWSGWHTNFQGEKYVYLNEIKPGGNYPRGIVGSLMSPDSVDLLPASRPDRRTFLEFWNDTLYLRFEGDTVHMNCYAILHNGGFDSDSPYLVRVTDLARSDTTFPGGVVLNPNPKPNGSPIGFRVRMEAVMTPDNSSLLFGQSGLYPVFDPNDVANVKKIATYWPSYVSGTFYALALAEDGDGAIDTRVTNARLIASQPNNPLRSKVLVFHVNRNPYFFTSNPVFSPKPGQVFTDLNWQLNLPAIDPDPFFDNPGRPTPRGNSSTDKTFRIKLKVRGKNAAGQDVEWVDPNVYVNQEVINIFVQAPLAAGPAQLIAELCDCSDCEARPGTGRCVTAVFNVIYAPPGSEMSSSRPGNDRR